MNPDLFAHPSIFVLLVAAICAAFMFNPAAFASFFSVANGPADYNGQAKPSLALFNEGEGEGEGSGDGDGDGSEGDEGGDDGDEDGSEGEGEDGSGDGDGDGDGDGSEAENALNTGTMEDRLAAHQKALRDEKAKSALLAKEATDFKAEAETEKAARKKAEGEAVQAKADCAKAEAERDTAQEEAKSAKAAQKAAEDSLPGKIQEGMAKLGVPAVDGEGGGESRKPGKGGQSELKGRGRTEAAIKSQLES